MSHLPRLWKRSFRRFLTIILCSALLFLSTPLSVSALVIRDASKAVTEVSYEGWSFLSDLFKRSITNRTQSPRPEPTGIRPAQVPTKAERAARVATIQTNPPEEVTLKSRQPMWFSAIPLDSSGATIQGLTTEWESNNKQVIFIKKNGEALAGKPGTATVVVRAGSKQRTVRVTVVEGSNHRFGGKKTTDSTRAQSVAVDNSGEPKNNSLVAKRINAKRKRAHAATVNKISTSVPLFIRDPNDDPLPDNETSSLYQPANLIGTPPGKKKPGALTAGSAIGTSESGNKNFIFGLPVVGLGGRGVDVSLALIYNSLVYNKSTNPSNGSTWLTYDVDSGYPAQGFRLGYGQIEDQGSAGFTLTESNGTRRALVYSTSYTYDTNDGSFIRFIGGSGWGTLYYSDGMQVTYGASGNGYRSYPTKITDRNGNYILISYVNSTGPRINTIQDTMGRYIRFYYDSNYDLVTITMPGLTGQSDIQVMRFYYENLSLTTSGLFSSTINVDIGTNARVLKYIYLPASAEGSSSSDGDCGYRFNYSPYGMIYQIVKFRGMTASTTSTSSTGTVTEGTNTTAATTTYGYPTSASNLTDVPTFASRTDDWAGRTTSSAPQYTFAVTEPTGETVSTVTAPDGTVTESHAVRSSGAWNDGLITEVRVQNATPTVFAKTVMSWEQNASNGTPRIANVKMTNEASKTRATVFSYDSSTTYNNVSEFSERDFTTDGSISSTELRRTKTDYVTSSSYLNRRLLHLPSMIRVYPGNSTTAAAKVEYAHDNYGASHANLTSRDDIIMHDPAFDPFQEPQETWDWVCTEWGYTEGGIWDCLNWEWQMTGYYNPYESSTDYRGNVTSVTTYPDATSSSNSITHATTYDIAGNVITAQVDCCQQKSFTFTDTYEYAYPTSVKDGNPSGLHLTNSITYDFNTGLVATTTDPNSQVTSVSYNTDTLRTSQVNFADGGRVSYDYGDNLVADSSSKYHSRVTATTKLDSSRYVDSKSYFDGRGAPAATFNSYTSGNGWSITNIQYDSMGRAYRASNPYFSTSDYGTVAINSAGIWTTNTFDNLGRVTQVTMPRGDDQNPSHTVSVQSCIREM